MHPLPMSIWDMHAWLYLWDSGAIWSKPLQPQGDSVAKLMWLTCANPGSTSFPGQELYLSVWWPSPPFVWAHVIGKPGPQLVRQHFCKNAVPPSSTAVPGCGWSCESCTNFILPMYPNRESYTWGFQSGVPKVRLQFHRTRSGMRQRPLQMSAVWDSVWVSVGPLVGIP